VILLVKVRLLLCIVLKKINKKTEEMTHEFKGSKKTVVSEQKMAETEENDFSADHE